MGTYAVAADVEAYIEGGTGLDAATVERYIVRAERDVDRAVNVVIGRRTSGLKFDPVTDLDATQREALERATCAQVEYRLRMGDDFFVQHQRESMSGPETSVSGRVPRIGPQVRDELISGGLYATTARMR